MKIRSWTVLVALLLCPSFLQAAPAGSNDVWFVQLTDTHLGVIDHDTVLAQMADAINRLPFPVSCVVMTGDLAMDNFDKPAVRAAATSLLGRIRVPVHVIPGNHDLGPKSAPETLAAWTNLFGPLGSTADYGGVRFVFVFTEDLVRKGPARDFNPFAFLADELRKAGDRPVLLFQHGPWVEDFYNNTVHPGWPDGFRARWSELVRSGPVKAVVTGHYHRDELHWEGDVPVHVGQAAARFWGRQPCFRIYRWHDDRLSYRTWYISDVPKEKAGK